MSSSSGAEDSHCCRNNTVQLFNGRSLNVQPQHDSFKSLIANLGKLNLAIYVGMITDTEGHD
jgi:hypothetical protein